MQQTSIPKGTRDFSPQEMVKRNYIFSVIREVYELYGFLPIETPAMENLSTLMGKYGEEGDKLLFRILNSGNYLQGIPASDMKEENTHALSSKMCEKGLRYDLTVPFARYVVMHRNEIAFPFRRYQIQPVWRADRPQKGRYREFYQCDADVVGSDSLLNETELINIIDKVFQKFDTKILIKINNRKILAGIAEYIGHPNSLVDITTAIDKIDKIGLEKVNQELEERGLDKKAIDALQPFLNLTGNSHEKLLVIKSLLKATAIGMKGIEETETLFAYLAEQNMKAEIELDLRLARGLNYYTGTIIEVKSTEVEIGSICGGGRYDNLTGIFGMEGVSGVGISFGADRIYDVLNQLNRFPSSAIRSTKVLFVNFGVQEEKYCLHLSNILREHKVSCVVYPDQAKMKKQMAYADSIKVPYVVIIGEEELKNKSITLKIMDSGEQKIMTEEEFVNFFSKMMC